MLHFLSSKSGSNFCLNLSQWYLPSWQKLRRAVALLIALCFVLPTVSWAFNADSYLYPDTQQVWLGKPGSKHLALEYSVPEHMGKVVAASKSAGDLTFVLIQDLHCHAEIQSNVRDMLDVLITRHPDIQMIAEEGASGIVPLLELATLPDSMEKRAVVEYFVRQGKMTGSDWYVVLGHPEVELFGAEDEQLYQSSLELIRDFSTEENNGLLMELLDQLDMLQEKNYNKALLAFERRRTFYQKASADTNQYYQTLLKEAQEQNINPVPTSISGSRKLGNLDYHAQTQHMLYLENELSQRLLLTEAERKLFSYQQYVEVVERIVNVSASREDLQTLQSMSATLSVQIIAQELEAIINTEYLNSAEDMVHLTKSVKKALRFYSLADKRDQAFLKNTIQRLRDRGEKKVIMVTGGYHTQAVQTQIVKLGHSYITVQPSMTETETNTNYFELLRHPNQPTDLESVIAQSLQAPAAIAVPKTTATPGFASMFKSGIAVARLARQIMSGKRIPSITNISFARSADGKYVVATTPRGTFYISLSKKGLYIGKDVTELGQRSGDKALETSGQVRKTVFALPAVRIAGLALAGVGLIMLLNVSFVPLGLFVLFGSFVLLGGWNVSRFRGFSNPVAARRVAVILTVAVGTLFLVSLAGPTVAEVTNYLSANDSVPYYILDSLISSVRGTFATVFSFLGLQVYPHDPMQAVATGKAIVGMASVLFGSTAAAASIAGLVGRITLESTEESLGADFFDLEAKEERLRDFIKRGRKYESGEEHTAPNTFEVVSAEATGLMMDVLVAHNLRESVTEKEGQAPNRRMPFIDTYHKAHTAVAGPHIDRVQVGVQTWTQGQDEQSQVLMRVTITDPQFFGDKDFVEADFEFDEVIAQLRTFFKPTRTAPKRQIDGLLLAKLGISKLAELDAQRNKPEKFVKEFTQVVNFHLEETEFYQNIDYHTYDQVPEIAEIIKEAKIRIDAGDQLAVGERRKYNRALFEVLFPKQERQGRPTEIPSEWIRGVLNVLNPMVYLAAFGKELGVYIDDQGKLRRGEKGLLDKVSPQLREAYEQIILKNAKRWRGLVPFVNVTENIATAEDLEMAKSIHAAAILHEVSHTTALHVPWKRGADMSDAEWARQEKFNISAIQDLYESNPELTATACFTKNMVKGLHVVRDSNDPVAVTENVVRLTTALETYCDRFGMYLFQNYFKLQSYRDMIGKMGNRFTGETPEKVDAMYALEEMRQAGQLEQVGFTIAEIAELERRLDEDTKRHPFVHIGDTPILPQEEVIYRQNWELLHNFAEEGKFGVLSREHFESSPFVNLHHHPKYGIENAEFGFLSLVNEAMERGLHPLAALATATVKSTVGQDGKEVLHDMDEGGHTVKQVIEEATDPFAALDALDMDQGVVLPTEKAVVTADATTTETAPDKIPAKSNLPRVFEIGLADKGLALSLASFDVAKTDVDMPSEEAIDTALEGKDPFAVLDELELQDSEGKLNLAKTSEVTVDGSGAKMESGLGKKSGYFDVASNRTISIPQMAANPGLADTTDSTVGEPVVAADLATPGETLPVISKGIGTTGKSGVEQGTQVAPGEMADGLVPEVFGEGNLANLNAMGLGQQTLVGAARGSVADPMNAWSVAPGEGLFGMGRQGSAFAGARTVPFALSDLPTTLNLPTGLREQGMADPRATYLIGQAEAMLANLPAGQNIIFGFDSAELAAYMDGVLNAMRSTPGGAALANRVETKLFPLDSKGLRSPAENWQAENGIAVLSENMSNQRPVTIALDKQGNAAMAVGLKAMPMDEAEKAFKGQEGWEDLLAAHRAQMKTMQNQNDLQGYFLVSAANVRQIQERQPGLLTNMMTSVTGFQNVQSTGLKLPMDSIRAAVQPSFDNGAQRVTVDFNAAGWMGLQGYMNASDAQAVIVFGSNQILMSSEAGYNVNASFLSHLLRADTLESAPLDMTVDENALANKYGINKQSLFAKWVAALEDLLLKNKGVQAAEKVGLDEAEAMKDDLIGFDTVTMVAKSKRFGAHLERMRGTSWSQQPSLFSGDVYYRFKHGRNANKPLSEIAAWNPTIDASKLVKPTALSKITSAILLGIAMGVLLVETVIAFVQTRDADGKRMPLSLLLKNRNTGQSFLTMARVVFGSKRVLNQLSPMVKQQVSDMQSAVETMDALQVDELEQLPAEQLPQSLRYSIGQFTLFKNLLKGNQLVRMLRFLRAIPGVNRLLPELFVLLSQSNRMQNVMYYHASEMTLRKKFAEQQNLPQTLRDNLRRSPQEAQSQLEQAEATLVQLEVAATPDLAQIAALRTVIANLRLTVRVDTILTRIGKAKTARRKQTRTYFLTKILLAELSRRDVPKSEEYQTGVLQLLTMIQPFEQTAVQIRLASGTLVQTTLPAALYETVLRDKLINFMDVFTQEGKPLAPLMRKVLRSGASA
jgi:hypothetical protein